MKVLITTAVDPRNSAYSRLHAIIGHLKDRHDVTIVSVRDYWKEKQESSKTHRIEFERNLGDVNLVYLTDRRRAIWLQEVLSRRRIRGLLESGSIETPDVILDYNTLLTGRHVTECLPMVPRIYDIADDLPDMIRNSPQVPLRQGFVASRIAAKMIIKSMNSARLVSTTTADLSRRYHAPLEKTVVIPNGVHYAQLEKSAGERNSGCARNPNEFVLIYVGVLREWVNLEPIMKAINELRPNIKVNLVIVGDEGNAPGVREHAVRYGVEDRVTMTGTIPHDQIGSHIASSDCGIIPFTRGETAEMALPLKLFEYLAVGVPVISTRIPAVVERFRDEVYFYDTEEELVSRIKEITGNPVQMRKRAAEGKRKVREQYSWDSVLTSLDDSIRRVVDHMTTLECRDGSKSKETCI